VRDSARPLLRQTWVILILAAIGAALAGPARAQGPGPDPGPTIVQNPRPDPAPTRRREQSSPTTKQTPTVIARAPAIQPSPVAPQPPFSPPPPAPVQRARTEAPQRPAAAKPRRARAPSRKQRAKQTLRAIRSVAASTESSPDGMLLAGGLALFALLLGEAIFLALSVRFLRTTA
jgi:hypothetical protein